MPHICRTGNASGRRRQRIDARGSAPSVTKATARRALADVLRMFADPIRAAVSK
jgi:hypothetical protein